jgi:hypothetical protein
MTYPARRQCLVLLRHALHDDRYTPEAPVLCIDIAHDENDVHWLEDSIATD